MSDLQEISRPPRSTATNVLVLHRSAVVAAGLASTLQRMPDCNVRVGDEEPWDDDAALDGIDVLVADARLLAQRRDRPVRDGATAMALPRVVLFATHADDESILKSLWRGVSACLSIRSGEAEIFAAVRGDLPNGWGAARLDGATPARADGPAPRPLGGLPPRALRRVRDHVEQHLSEKIQLADLATIAGLSECHFSRAFKQSVGIPPHRYVMRRRIEAAARLIERTDRALTDIGLDVGFSDQSHFTRVFFSLMGETPRAFRHQCR